MKVGGAGIIARILALALALPIAIRGESVAEAALATRKTVKAVPLPQLLTDIEAKYSQARTLSARFDQTVESAITRQKQKSSGLLSFKRPNRIRWETEKPDRSLFVSDGRKAWYYTPGFDESENGSYHELPAGKAQSRLANALLSGSFSVARDMKIHQDSALRFTLTPRKGGPIAKALIDIEPRTLVIQRVTIHHADGNRTEVMLSGVELGKPLPDENFTFVPPAHTDRIDD